MRNMDHFCHQGIRQVSPQGIFVKILRRFRSTAVAVELGLGAHAEAESGAEVVENYRATVLCR